MDHHLFHAQRIRNQTRVLTTGAAKALQRVMRHVIAALHRDFLDCIGHILDRDAQKTFGQLFGRGRGAAGFLCDIRCQFGKFCTDDINVERLVRIWSEDGGKVARLQFSQHHVAIRHSQRTAAPIASGAGIGACAFRAHLETAIAIEQDRTATRCNRVDIHHRRPHPHACDLGFKAALIGSGVMTDVRRRTAHVEPNQLVVSGQSARFDHAHNAACRP